MNVKTNQLNKSHKPYCLFRNFVLLEFNILIDIYKIDLKTKTKHEKNLVLLFTGNPLVGMRGK